jgi:hypothetical protein
MVFLGARVVVVLCRGFALLDSVVGPRWLAGRSGAWAPEEQAERAHAAVLLRFRLLKVKGQEPT